MGRRRPPKTPRDSDDQPQTVQPARRRGRLLKPKPKQSNDEVQQDGLTPKRGRGRPPKAKSQGAEMPASATTEKAKSTKAGSRPTTTKTAPKPRGRPRKSNTGAAKEAIQGSSIVGGYSITCKAISEEWPDQDDHFGLDISESSTFGVFEGSFDFGILEGAMVLSSDEGLLDAHVDKLEADEGDEYGYDDEEDDGDEDEDEPTVSGGKRKATSTARGQPAKKVKKASPGSALRFHILWRGRDTSEGEIHSGPGHGAIKFTNKNYTKLTGEIDLPHAGEGVEITGERVTDQSNAGDSSSWNDYSEAAYERANVSRWH